MQTAFYLYPFASAHLCASSKSHTRQKWCICGATCVLIEHRSRWAAQDALVTLNCDFVSHILHHLLATMPNMPRPMLEKYQVSSAAQAGTEQQQERVHEMGFLYI